MRRTSRGFRPSPAIVVAIMALVAAAAGTAIADPGATASKITKKKVTNIARNVANQQIDARAPGLTVGKANEATTASHANTATTATTANHANTSTNADTAANANALSGNTIVAEGNIDGPGLVTNSSCTLVTAPATGAQAGDHVVVTPPTGWPTYEINLTGRVTAADTVGYEICNQSGVMQNFGTSPPVRFLIFR